MRKPKIITIILAATLLASCSDDLNDYSGLNRSSSVMFDISTTELENLSGQERETRSANSPSGNVLLTPKSGQKFYMQLSNIPHVAVSNSVEPKITTNATRSSVTSTSNFSNNVESMWVNSCIDGNFTNEAVTRANNWMTTNASWSRSATALSFWAIAPWDGKVNATVNSATQPNGQTGMPTYTITATGSDTPDLLFAQSDQMQGSNYTAVPMRFRHALACFAVQSGQLRSGLIIKSLTIKQIYTHGTYAPSRNGQDSWTPTGNLSDVTINLTGSDGKTQTTGYRGEHLNTDNGYAFLIPQSLKGKTIVVTYQDAVLDAGKDHTMTFNITDDVDLKEGYTNWCTLSATAIKFEYTLGVTVNNVAAKDGINTLEMGALGGTGLISIDSYIDNKAKKTQTPVKYNIDFSSTAPDDKGNADWQPLEKLGDSYTNWISNVPYWTDNGQANSTGLLTTKLIKGKASTDMTEVMRGKPEIGWADANHTRAAWVDLSKRDINGIEVSKRNTANCYVINCGGNYEIPMVYGNAIENGEENPESYNNINGMATYPSFIINNNVINTPSIVRQVGTGVKARLLWADGITEDAINNIQVRSGSSTSNPGFIRFHVDGSKIHPGNAVIVLEKDLSRNYTNQEDGFSNGTSSAETSDTRKCIVWSWHLWFIDYNFSEDLIKNNYGFLGVPLGWAPEDGKIYSYPEHTVYMRISIDADPSNYRIYKVHQEASSNQVGPGTTTLYQYGRKDPFVADLFDKDADGMIKADIYVDSTKAYSNKIFSNLIINQTPNAKMKFRMLEIPTHNVTKNGNSGIKDCWNSIILAREHPDIVYSTFTRMDEDTTKKFAHVKNDYVFWHTWQFWDSRNTEGGYTATHPTGISNILWNSNNSFESKPENNPSPHCKTVYDPCPAGWRVPSTEMYNYARAASKDWYPFPYWIPVWDGGINYAPKVLTMSKYQRKQDVARFWIANLYLGVLHPGEEAPRSFSRGYQVYEPSDDGYRMRSYRVSASECVQTNWFNGAAGGNNPFDWEVPADGLVPVMPYQDDNNIIYTGK